MNKNDYFLYNNGAESPLAMIKILNNALRNKQSSASSKKATTNPHRPQSMYNPACSQSQASKTSNQTVNNRSGKQQPAIVVKSTAHTSIQKLVKLDTDLLPTTTSNYVIKYPVKVI